MIRAMIFDLDGTLVQTERLKALPYARATVELCPSLSAKQKRWKRSKTRWASYAAGGAGAGETVRPRRESSGTW